MRQLPLLFFPAGTEVPARHVLMRFMQYWSEEHYGASWATALERSLGHSGDQEAVETLWPAPAMNGLRSAAVADR